MGMNNTEIAYEFIRRKILEGDYPPGHALQTADLAEETGVSRTPVRDALRMLETDGLVVIRSRAGAKVRQIPAVEYKQLCEFRQSLEGFGAFLAAGRRTTPDLALIGEHLDAMKNLSTKLTKAKDPLQHLPEMARVDGLFHLAIMVAAGNELMHRELIRIQLIFRVMAGRQQKTLKSLPNETAWRSRRQEIQLEHEAIFAAIEAGEPVRARQTMETHIELISQVEVVALEREEKARLQEDMGV